MFTSNSAIHIGIYGSEVARTGRGVGLWQPGYQSTVNAAGGNPIFLDPNHGDDSWDEVLADFHGVVICGHGQDPAAKLGDVESLCLWCQRHQFPMLAIDRGMLAMNTALGGTNYLDLAREVPEALQHRHPPEPGVRHAIMIEPGTLMEQLYGEGEVVVNSEHRQAIEQLAKGFRVGARALDGVIEAVESQDPAWFALAVQWQPASSYASGLDIQVFRSLIEGAKQALLKPVRKPRRLAVAG